MTTYPLRIAAITPLLFLFSIACSPENQRTDRDPTKADEILSGSCEASCNEVAMDGNCWCDVQCTGFGDCCDNLANFCPDVAPACGELNIPECEDRFDCALEAGVGEAINCTDVVDLPACTSGLTPSECTERDDCALEAGPGGALNCMDAVPQICGGLTIEECIDRDDCSVISGPGGSISCAEIDVLPGCVGLDIAACEERFDCAIAAGPGGSISCAEIDIPPDCVGLDIAACEERFDCAIAAGPGGAINCVEAG